MTIIERDIAFYESEVERLRDNMRRCEPQHEAMWTEQWVRARDVVIALRCYAGEQAPNTAKALGIGPT